MTTLAESLYESQDIESVETVLHKLQMAVCILNSAVHEDGEVDSERVAVVIEILEGV